MNGIAAAVLSFIIPGLGQIFSGEVMRGIILFLAAVIVSGLALFIFRTWFVYIIDILISIYAAYDAYMLNQ